jgi:transcriptional regulator with XRE-family HTH domain
VETPGNESVSSDVTLDMPIAAELGAFLRSRRIRREPEDLGITRAGLRRTPGLRREEVAVLAGVSVDYYSRLEQGRAKRPSLSVLQMLADVLDLDENERSHLLALGTTELSARPGQSVSSSVRTSVRGMIAMWPTPAWVINHRLDVLAWNAAAAALLTDWGERPVHQRNMLQFALFDPAARALYGSWQRSTREFIGKLRTACARWPEDPETIALVEELVERSPEFREWWQRYEVVEPTGGRLLLQHPIVGELSVNYEVLALAGRDEQRVVVVSAEPGTRSARQLKRLAMVAGRHRESKPSPLMPDDGSHG